MKLSDILADEYKVVYEKENQRLLIYRVIDGKIQSLSPASHKLSMLKKMGKEEACRWVGETILMTISDVRKEVFGEIE